MNKVNPKFRSNLLVILIILFSTVIYSQETKEKKALTDILNSLQKTYKYQFTYANDVVDGIVIYPPPNELTLSETIKYLEKKTSLVFKFLDNHFIAINAKENSFFICGYVIDGEFREPISGVTIIGNTNHTISDQFGYFKLKVSSKKETLNLRSLGYKTTSILASSFNDEICKTIFLKPQIETLSEIVLTGYIAKGIDKVVDGSFNIDFSNFGIVPGLIETDVLQTVQALPGIQSIDESVSNINIRGGTNDQNLILWDGIKMYQSGHFFGLISMFNPLMTNNVTIIKNGTSAELGDGVSGTIDMRTDNKITKKLNGSLGINFINADGFIDIPLGKKASIQIAARKSINNIVQTPTYKQYYKRILQDSELTYSSTNKKSDILFDFYDASTRLLYNITPKDQVQLNFFVGDDTFTAFNNSIESKLNQNSLATGLKYKREWNEKFYTSLQFYESDYKLEATNITSDKSIANENNVSESSVKLNSWYKLNSQLKLLNGYQYTETGVTEITDRDNPLLFREDKNIIREHALYTQATYTSKSNYTNIKIGTRCNFLNLIYGTQTNEKINKFMIEPRFSINQKINTNFSVELIGEMKHQSTTQIINFSYLSDLDDGEISPTDYINIEKRKWLAADEDQIHIIESKQLSTGINFTNNGWLINLDGYYKEVSGINSQSQGFLNQYEEALATGSYKVKGVEFLLNKKINKISSWLSYSFADNNYRFIELEDVQFPNNLDISHSVTLGTSYASKKLKVSLGFNWHSGAPTTLPVKGNETSNNAVNFEPSNSSRLEDYTRLDASATYNFNIAKNIRANVGASVWNLLNKKNIIYNYFRYDTANNEVLEIKKQALHLTPNLSFRVLF